MKAVHFPCSWMYLKLALDASHTHIHTNYNLSVGGGKVVPFFRLFLSFLELIGLYNGLLLASSVIHVSRFFLLTNNFGFSLKHCSLLLCRPLWSAHSSQSENKATWALCVTHSKYKDQNSTHTHTHLWTVFFIGSVIGKLIYGWAHCIIHDWSQSVN